MPATAVQRSSVKILLPTGTSTLERPQCLCRSRFYAFNACIGPGALHCGVDSMKEQLRAIEPAPLR
jgi:hypothetical protein